MRNEILKESTPIDDMAELWKLVKFMDSLARLALTSEFPPAQDELSRLDRLGEHLL